MRVLVALILPHAHTHTLTHTYIHTLTHIYIHTLTHTYTHTLTHTLIHTYPYLPPPLQVRKIIAKRLLESKTTIPHMYVSADVDLTAVNQLRESLKAQGIKVCEGAGWWGVGG